MGSSQSCSPDPTLDGASSDDLENKIQDVVLQNEPNIPHFNEEQKTTLRDSWSKVHSKMDAIGAVVFLRYRKSSIRSQPCVL